MKDFESITLHLTSATIDEMLHAFNYGLKPAIRT